MRTRRELRNVLWLAVLTVFVATTWSACSTGETGSQVGSTHAAGARVRLASGDGADACGACEASICVPQGVGCGQLAEPGKSACEAAVACMKNTGCAVDGDASYCYCGTADQNDGSCAAAPLGACEAELEAADPNLLPSDSAPQRFSKIASDFVDPTLPIGAATGLIGCDALSCMSECAAAGGVGGAGEGGGGEGGAGEGGVSGAGGDSGNGGAVGLGGASAGGDSSGNAGAPGSGGGVAGDAGPAGGASAGGTGGDASACGICESSVCTPQGVGCGTLVGAARTACDALTACMKTTGCAIDGDASYCYCGAASQDDGSCAEAPLGVCRAEVEAADPNILGTDTAQQRFAKIATDFVDPSLPIGEATGLIECDALSCPDACVFPLPGSGGSSGAGGADAGTGGSATGAGGAGTGGSDLGTGGADLGTGGADLGPGGAAPGTGGADLGTGGADLGPGGAATGGADLGTGGADLGAGGASVGTGGADLGAGGASVGTGGADVGAGGTAGDAANGGASALGGAGGGASGGAPGAGGASACDACEASVCTPQGVGCSAFTGDAAVACQTAVDCMRATHCAIDGDASYCYCGDASIDDGSCASAPLGVCKAALEAADPNLLPDDGVVARFNKVAVDFTDPGLPIGQATQLLGCLSYFCNTPDTCAGQF